MSQDRTLRPSLEVRHKYGSPSFCWSPSEQYLAVAQRSSSAYSLCCYECASGRELFKLESKNPWRCGWRGDELLWTLTKENDLPVLGAYAVPIGGCVRSLDGVLTSVSNASFDSSGTKLATYDGIVDLEVGALLPSAQQIFGEIIRWSPDGDPLAALSYSGNIVSIFGSDGALRCTVTVPGQCEGREDVVPLSKKSWLEWVDKRTVIVAGLVDEENVPLVSWIDIEQGVCVRTLRVSGMNKQFGSWARISPGRTRLLVVSADEEIILGTNVRLSDGEHEYLGLLNRGREGQYQSEHWLDEQNLIILRGQYSEKKPEWELEIRSTKSQRYWDALLVRMPGAPNGCELLASPRRKWLIVLEKHSFWAQLSTAPLLERLPGSDPLPPPALIHSSTAQLSWSIDEQRVAIQEMRENKVSVYQLGEPTLLFVKNFDEAVMLSWDAQDRLWAVPRGITQGRGLQVFSLGGDLLQSVSILDELSSIYEQMVSPDGASLVLRCGTTKGDTIVFLSLLDAFVRWSKKLSAFLLPEKDYSAEDEFEEIEQNLAGTLGAFAPDGSAFTIFSGKVNKLFVIESNGDRRSCIPAYEDYTELVRWLSADILVTLESFYGDKKEIIWFNANTGAKEKTIPLYNLWDVGLWPAPKKPRLLITDKAKLGEGEPRPQKILYEDKDPEDISDLIEEYEITDMQSFTEKWAVREAVWFDDDSLLFLVSYSRHGKPNEQWLARVKGRPYNPAQRVCLNTSETLTSLRQSPNRGYLSMCFGEQRRWFTRASLGLDLPKP
jgi:hypothetical protein